MSTAIQDTAIHEALARLQDTPKPNDRSWAAWFDQHMDDLLVLLQAKGTPITADLLGTTQACIRSWLSSRMISISLPRLSRDGQHKLTPNQLHPQFTPGGPAPSVRGEPVSPRTESPAYIRGQRDAYRDILDRLTIIAKEK